MSGYYYLNLYKNDSPKINFEVILVSIHRGYLRSTQLT